MPAKFQAYVPPRDHPRVEGLSRTDIQTYSAETLKRPIVHELVSNWANNLKEPFYGITKDGHRTENLYNLSDEGAPVEQMVTCAKHVLNLLKDRAREHFHHKIDSDDWRKWSNPEFLLYRTGLRLEDLEDREIKSVMALIEASTSSAGYSRIVGAMLTNEYLGELCNAKTILNKHSYQFSIFGEPSLTQPWGYSLFGHHLCLNIFVLGKQMIASPIFIGAEPNEIETGPHTGVRILDSAGDLALIMMQSLPAQQQQKAQIFEYLHDELMPKDRWNPADQRHLGGASQDNRVIPYEGIEASTMPKAQQDQLTQLLSSFTEILPPGPFSARMKQIERHWNETYFCWIGGFSDDDAFYYRIQSPVVMIEYDHHSGVFLLNKEPAKFHIHTIIRTPNGNDYGKKLLHLHREMQS